MRKLLIIGGGGSTVGIDTAISTNKYSKISYLDDNKEKFVKT